jgi:nucleoside 2-deoxyribosyltransferase
MGYGSGMIYIAGPYRHDDPRVMMMRYFSFCKYAHKLLLDGKLCFSPISHSAPIEDLGLIPHEVWMEVDIKILKICDVIHVLMLDGWKDSKGTSEEIDIAFKRRIPIIYVGESEIES